ncbi:MAG: substrate-binding domain-containing protein [Alphaproteobacteria bacterium]|nr:substrate-binding domain-containing protein [Alphaproteobacteria bacterium]
MNRPAATIALAVLAGALAAPAGAQLSTDLVSRSEFRVCADPNNLPFSNDKQAGFENKIAELIAKDLNEPVGYTWFPQTVGFVRNTLLADRCDVVMGTVAAGEMMDDTNPYYRSAYMIVTRADDNIAATSLADSALAGKRFGLIAGTPPTDLLLKHNLLAQTASYSLLIDTRYESPSRQMLQDLIDKKIDVALLWGPYAGYFIAEEHLPLHAALLASEPNGPKLDYYIAMGVRPGETAWRRTLNRSILKHQDEITRILLDYHVPLLDAQNRLITDASPH